MARPANPHDGRGAEAVRPGGGLRSFILGALAALAGMGLVGLVVVEAGLFDTRASTPHGPLVAWATHTTMLRWVATHAPAGAPARFTTAQVQAGFRDYEAACVACHGGPGVNRAGWTAGLNPTPPYLLDSARRFSPSELHLLVSDGVKMTAMPAWRATRTDAQVWDLVAFLEALPAISPAQYAQMRRTLQPPPAVAP